MTDAIRAAQAVLQAECDKLTAALVAKGYPAAHGEIWINWNGGEIVVKIERVPEIMWTSYFGKHIADVFAQAMEAIAALPDPNAYDAWFEWPQAEAAE